ncbi:MAG TPA: hypothetical protein VIX59_21720 [Candidatus Binataceae bacterium]
MQSKLISRLGTVVRYGLVMRVSAIAAGATLLALGSGTAKAADAAPLATPPYSLTTFAVSENGYTDPDSVTFNESNIFVGYGNGGNPDGSGGAMSTIVEYDMTGKVVTTFTVTGHNDGLRINPDDGTLCALQNEDANANLVIIDLRSNNQTVLQFPTPAPHGGGYDDLVFTEDGIFVSASNPANNPNTGPAIVSIKTSHKTIEVKPVFAGTASATNVLTGASETLNLQDPDSMILDPFGELILDSQGDGEEIIVHHAGQRCQSAFVVPLTYPTGGGTFAGIMADDTAFATSNQGFIIFADKTLQKVFKIAAPYFFIGAAYTAFQDDSGTLGFVGRTDFTTGVSTPIITGLGNPGGMAFVPANFGRLSVPEIPDCD